MCGLYADQSQCLIVIEVLSEHRDWGGNSWMRKGIIVIITNFYGLNSFSELWILYPWPTLQRSCAIGTGWELLCCRRYVTAHRYISRAMSCHRVNDNLHLKRKVKSNVCWDVYSLTVYTKVSEERAAPILRTEEYAEIEKKSSHWFASSPGPPSPYIRTTLLSRSAYFSIRKMEVALFSKMPLKSTRLHGIIWWLIFIVTTVRTSRRRVTLHVHHESEVWSLEEFTAACFTKIHSSPILNLICYGYNSHIEVYNQKQRSYTEKFKICPWQIEAALYGQ
jgi:hypothetical protein